MTRSPRLLWLFAFALFARAVLPSGWMPSSMPGQVVMLCTDAGLQQAWVDEEGTLHKSDGNSQHDQSPCAFAGLASGHDVPEMPSAQPLPAAPSANEPAFAAIVAIGQGLAAPPPPKTGPPLNA